MSAATFNCPHCGHLYPIKPALIGKAVRCTACRNAFSLRPDGIADKIESPAPVVPAAPIPPPLPASSPIAPITPSAPLSPPTPKAALTKQQQDARKAMAESLRASVNEALKAESLGGGDDEFDPPETTGRPKTEAQRKGTESQRKGTESQRRGTERQGKPSASGRQPLDPKKIRKGPVLTDEGEREAQITRRWWMVLAATILIVGGISYLATRVNERLAAVHAFTTELPPSDLSYGRRDRAIVARAWSPPVLPFIDLPNPVLGPTREIPGKDLTELVRPLDGLVYVPAAQCWIAPAKVDWLTKQLADGSSGLLERLSKSGTVLVERAALRKSLTQNLGDEAAGVMDAILSSSLASKFLPPAVPPTVNWCEAHGTEGRYLVDDGLSYSIPTANWRGLLVGLASADNRQEWRFLTLDIDRPTY